MQRVARRLRSRPEPDPSALAESLKILERNRRYADSQGIPSQQHAVLISTLEAVGLSESDLLWLVEHDYLEHVVDCTRPGDNVRRLRKSAGTAFGPRACFALTDTGMVIARRMLGDDAENRALTGTTPRWDASRRELRVGRVVVKRFRVPARNQIAIIAAFEEQGWPERIDDPLPRSLDRDPRERLHDAISRLNHVHLVPLLTFHGDGTGSGICWRMKRE